VEYLLLPFWPIRENLWKGGFIRIFDFLREKDSIRCEKFKFNDFFAHVLNNLPPCYKAVVVISGGNFNFGGEKFNYDYFFAHVLTFCPSFIPGELIDGREETEKGLDDSVHGGSRFYLDYQRGTLRIALSAIEFVIHRHI
jgi:hypothetical protein